VAVERTDAIIAGVNKAGTTSLFVSLSTHPDVAPSSIKETRYFLPARYGTPLEPASVWNGYFADAGDRPVHLEATPSYFYGAERVAGALRDHLVNPHALLVFREPVSRAISFFTYQKVRLRFPADYPIEDYLAAADALGPDEFLDPENEKYMAFRGGCYADYLPAWLDTLALGPAVAPDIVMAIGLLALYVTLGMTLGLYSVLLSHAVFGTALVTAIVRARLGHMDPSLEEASRDLGASALSTFFRITIPGILPAVIAGALLTFTLSLDEFVIAYFTNGPATPTLPIVVYSMVRFGLTPEVNALGAVLLLVSIATILIAQRLTGLGADE
jgi:hypothetical protein